MVKLHRVRKICYHIDIGNRFGAPKMQTQTSPVKMQYLIFLLDGHPYALPLTDVEHILRAVEITPVPGAAPSLLGLINLQGEIIPVLNLRHRLNLPAREVELTDRLIITRGGGQKIALLVDAVRDIIAPSPEDIIAVADTSTDADLIRGAIKHGDEILFLCDFAKLPPLHTPASEQTVVR